MTTRPSAIQSSIPALSLVCLAFTSLAAFTGCQGPPEDDATDSESSEESLIRRGVRPCGNKLCAPGLVCCNASCGICTRPGESCIQQYCGPTPDDDAVSAGTCETDADCRVVASYCESCACLALSATDREPVCKQSPVRCLVNPCFRQRAYCDRGTCRLRPIGSPSGPAVH